jgi:hypothetical protein
MEPGFCKKHTRDTYRQEEKEKGIRYCDIDPGCFSLCIEGYASCQECLDKNRIVDSVRYNKRKQIIRAIQATANQNSLCAYCGSDFEPFLTKFGKDSLSCISCSDNQAIQDQKRKDRVRNFKNESYRNLKRYYKDYIKGASKRGYEISIDFDRFSTLVTSPCHYCGHCKSDETNGIDRVDNALGYTVDNCVSACWKCNRIKHAYHKTFFILKCHIMNNRALATPAFFSTWQMYYYRPCYKNFGAYVREAEGRGLAFNLTEPEWTLLTRSPCYLCGYQSPKGIGIDRLNNEDRSYTFENCRPCCGSCNDMKGEFTLEEFLDQCKQVVQVWQTPPEEVPDNPLKGIIANGVRTEERKHWKGLGLYYAILSDTAAPFVETYSDVYTSEEFDELCMVIKGTEKGAAIQTLQNLIRALKKRRSRAPPE